MHTDFLSSSFLLQIAHSRRLTVRRSFTNLFFARLKDIEPWNHLIRTYGVLSTCFVVALGRLADSYTDDIIKQPPSSASGIIPNSSRVIRYKSI
jgi:hypothetical protein